VLWTIIRKDQYEMDGDRIIIKWLGAIGWIELKIQGPNISEGRAGRAHDTL
jgi:putative transposase